MIMLNKEADKNL